jgi:hypothetical protein
MSTRRHIQDTSSVTSSATRLRTVLASGQRYKGTLSCGVPPPPQPAKWEVVDTDKELDSVVAEVVCESDTESIVASEEAGSGPVRSFARRAGAVIRPLPKELTGGNPKRQALLVAADFPGGPT